MYSFDPTFIAKYKNILPPFDGIGEIVYLRTYSRVKKDNTNEKWYETIERVVSTTYQIQKEWITQQKKIWHNEKANQSSQNMYTKIFDLKWTPPGRGLFAMDYDLVKQKGGAPLNNCAFVSTKNLLKEPTIPFLFLMDVSLYGVGCGFDTLGEGQIDIKKPLDEQITYQIEDSKEGWVHSIKLLLESYFYDNKPSVIYDYSLIRPKGMQLKTFGGTSAGADPLIDAHNTLKAILDKEIGKKITTTTIVDIMNILGKCVVSGGIRRTAEIAFGIPKDEFINLKNYEKNPDRINWGWTSNNSIQVDLGYDYKEIENLINENGEPGIIWLQNMREYSRTGESTYKDRRVDGANPCCEQSLENFELCNLVEVMLNRHDTLEEFLETLKYAFLYAKTVTLVPTHWAQTNEVMLRNRRIGCSVTGIAQFLAKHDLHELKKWLEIGYSKIQYYDVIYSEWFGIPRSIKTTSVKPSGTVSLLSNSTPGMHYPISRYYIRRIRFTKGHALLLEIKKKGYNIIENPPYESNTAIVEIPVDVGEGVRSAKEVSMWEQLELAAFLQQYWADNQVSVTITFNKQSEGKQIANALKYFQYRLKSVSFLPYEEHNYSYPPYEAITEETYIEQAKKINHNIAIDGSIVINTEPEAGCQNDSCIINESKLNSTK